MKNGYTEAITVSAISYLLPFRFLGNFEWKIILDTRIDVKLFNRKVKFKFYKYLTDAARVLKWSVICFRSIDSYLKPFPFFFFILFYVDDNFEIYQNTFYRRSLRIILFFVSNHPEFPAPARGATRRGFFVMRIIFKEPWNNDRKSHCLRIIMNNRNLKSLCYFFMDCINTIALNGSMILNTFFFLFLFRSVKTVEIFFFFNSKLIIYFIDW